MTLLEAQDEPTAELKLVAIPGMRPKKWDELLNAGHAQWKGCRTEKALISCAAAVVDELVAMRVKHYDQITSDNLEKLVDGWRKSKNRPGTILKKLSVLRRLGDVGMTRKPRLVEHALPKIKVRGKPAEKWWLHPELMAQVTTWARATVPDGDLVADYIEFVCFSGLRVEEVLRLRKDHFHRLDTLQPSFTVPGTKTVGSQKTLPLTEGAAAVARKRIALARDGRLFPIQYVDLKKRWLLVRTYLGQGHMHTCTLRALRRSFAKYANDRGMPTEELRKYLRHTSIITTQGYLHLVGAADEEGLRKWL